MTTLLASIVDATVALALALVAAAALKRRSAALRHVVLAAAIVAAALSPALERFVPLMPVIQWDDGAPVASSAAIVALAEAPSESVSIAAVAPATPPIPWTTLLVTVWLLGAMVTLAGLLIGLVRLGRLTARCVTVRAGRWREMADELTSASALRPVALLQSSDPSLLVTCGVLRPKIILPAGAETWTDERRRIVLAHEMAHVRRHDGAWQLAGELLRVIQWFNPLVWLACRRLRQESEHACDDAVLSGGIDATDYATHLLDVAKQVGRHHVWAPAPAIAHASTLERRVSAMLNHHLNREPLTRRARAVAVLAVAAVVVPLAAAGVAPAPDWPPATLAEGGDVTLAAAPVTPEPVQTLIAKWAEPAPQSASITTPQQVQVSTAIAVTEPDPADGNARVNVAIAATVVNAQQAPAAVRGTVLDQSGGALPGATLTLTDTESGLRFTTVTDNAGRFAFRERQPARYELAVSLSGFSTVASVIPLAAGATADRVIFLPIGTVEASITVDCAAALVAVRTTFQHALDRTLQALVPTLSAQQQAPVRVGGNIRAPSLLTQVRPACPKTPTPARETTVTLAARIGVDGSMSQVTPVVAERGAGELIDLARDAVRQWMFRPALLNGEAVEVNITIRIHYTGM